MTIHVCHAQYTAEDRGNKFKIEKVFSGKVKKETKNIIRHCVTGTTSNEGGVNQCSSDQFLVRLGGIQTPDR